MFENILFNTSGSVRRVSEDSVSYLIADATILVEGVYSGLHGYPVYYPGEVLKKDPHRWDGVPILNAHPIKDSKLVLVKDHPEYVEKIGMGEVRNTRYEEDSKKLRTELWFNENKVLAVEPTLLERLNSGAVTSLSTGMLGEGVILSNATLYDGKQYQVRVTGYDPDHLAVLMNSPGACTQRDGCGFPLANAAHTCSCQTQKKVLPLSNELSLGDTITMISSALYEKFNKPGYTWRGYVEDVFDDFFIYSVYTGEDFYSSGRKLYKMGYTKSDTGITLAGSPEEVKRVTDYVLAQQGVYLANCSNGVFLSNQERIQMFERVKHIDLLINSGGFVAADREWLEKLQDDQLKKILPKQALNDPAPPGTDRAPILMNAAPPVVPPATVPGAPPVTKLLTWTEILNNCDQQSKEILTEMGTSFHAERERLSSIILANAGNPFTKEELAVKTTAELRKLAQFAGGDSTQPHTMPQGAPLFLGAGGGIIPSPRQVAAPPEGNLRLPGLPIKTGEKQGAAS